jgi:hypothetical protein
MVKRFHGLTKNIFLTLSFERDHTINLAFQVYEQVLSAAAAGLSFAPIPAELGAYTARA